MLELIALFIVFAVWLPMAILSWIFQWLYSMADDAKEILDSWVSEQEKKTEAR